MAGSYVMSQGLRDIGHERADEEANQLCVFGGESTQKIINSYLAPVTI